jgi:kynurenine formamidase
MEKITEINGIRKLGKMVSNWGKWGPKDEAGTLNYVTPKMIVDAVRLVKKGAVFTLGIPMGAVGPQQQGKGRRFNTIHIMMRTGTDIHAEGRPAVGGADDSIMCCTHGSTHWDALGHNFLDGKTYNGFDSTEVTGDGAKKCSIEAFDNKLVGRGVLLDMARWKGVDKLEGGFGIGAEELDACADWEKVTIGKGDFLLIRTGQMQHYYLKNNWRGISYDSEPGLTIESAEWLHKKEVAAVAVDTMGCEVRPNATSSDIPQPWHKIVLPCMGLPMGEFFYLDKLAEDCDRDKVYEFLIVAPCLPIVGGVGSPINPYAMK